MHKKRSKRQLRIQLTFIYGLMIIAVVSIVAILVLVIQGYRYNRFDGKIEQGGLVQFDSSPDGATVTVDDTPLANKTASKITLTSGSHTVSMTRDGYSSWRKDVLVKPGSVLWLDYTRLFPNNPTIATAVQYDSVASALPSPNGKQFAVVAKADTPELSLTTLNDDTPQTTKVAIPAASFTAPAADMAQSFALLSWDKDSHLLLMSHVYGDKTEYLSLDIRDGKTHNLTAELGLALRKVEYSLADSNTLYALTTTNELRRITLSAATVSGPLVANVEDFSTNEERIVTYQTLADANGERTVGYVSSGATKAKTIGTYKQTEAATLRSTTGNYYGEHYTVILRDNTLKILKGDLPASDSNDTVSFAQVATLTIDGGGEYLGFSPGNNRMVYIGKGTKIITYDLELKTTATTALQSPLTRGVEWLDSYHLFVIGQSGYYYDFDGTNGQLFASTTLDLPAALSDNEKYIYYFTSTETGTALKRVKLTTN